MTKRARTPTPVRPRAAPQMPRQLVTEPEPPIVEEGEWEGLACTDVEVPPHVDGLTIASCRLERVRFTGCEIERFEANDVVFDDCELSGALLSGARLERVEFRRCRMSGVDLSRATVRDVLFDGCRLDDANLRAATLVSVDADDCDLRNADLYAATVERANLLRCDLTGVELSKATLERVVLHGSTLVDVKGASALAGAVIARDQIMPLAPSLVAAVGIIVDDDFHDAASPGAPVRR